MGMASVYYDLLNHLAIDASINPKGTSERLCAQQHLAYAGDNDLILYDRGYDAFWLYTLHIQHNLAFCMRARTNRDVVVMTKPRHEMQEIRHRSKYCAEGA